VSQHLRVGATLPVLNQHAGGKLEDFAVPYDTREGIQVEEEMQQAIGDWQYWVKQGYEL
jgi:hypothetical protein